MAVKPQSAERSAAPSPTQNRRDNFAVPGNRGVKIVRSCTVRKPAAELYRFWRSLENLTTIIKHPVVITRVSDTESHWKASAARNTYVEWDAVIINDHLNELIAWCSKEGAEIPNAGTVRFEPAPGDEGTEVTVQLEYDPPDGKMAGYLAKFAGGELEQQVAEALRRFKALMETGEIPPVAGQSGRR